MRLRVVAHHTAGEVRGDGTGHDGVDADPARRLVDELLRASPEFAEVWARHEVAVRTDQRQVLVHAEVGEVDLDCQVLHTEDRSQALLVLTATPGTPDADALELLCVLGTQMTGPTPPAGRT